MNHLSKQGRADINFYNCDNIEFMKSKPDNFYKLAIVDPEYGINADENAHKNGVNCKANGFKEHKKGGWDNKIPSLDYFNELQRISKNQIIWGGNYFTDFLKPVMSWIIWDKMQYNFSFADGEMAWSSFETKIKIFRYARGNESGFAPKIKKGFKQGLNIHPTQKPIKLYKWLLTNYAKPNDNILDTHGGSASIALACWDLGFDLDLCELDEDYFNDSWKRFETHSRQQQLF